MSESEIEKKARAGMVKSVEFLKDELRGVRTGQATPGLVDHLRIEVPSYGSTMQLRELASISLPDPGTIMIKPFDPSTTKDIERGLQSSDLGITPMSDGKIIRLPIPPLSGERRSQLSNSVKKMGEAQKIAVRNIRRDVNKQIDLDKKASKLSEDEADAAKEAIQKITKHHEDEIDKLISGKAKEIEAH
ncbi:MAG: ribosome recycling factor [Phycisphaerales bacterium]|nr:ribosome recycling factor [Phycisphaerales bacterium]